MEFLDNIFSKLYDKAESTAQAALENPGLAVSSTLKNNTMGWLTTPIRSAIGKSMLKNNDTILTDPRSTDGSFKTNWTDDYFEVSADDKKGQALSVLQNNPAYKPLRAAGYTFTDGDNVKSTSDISSALTIASDPLYREYIAKGGKTGKIDLDNATIETVARQSQVQDAKNTISRLSGSYEGLSDTEIEGLATRLQEEDTNRATVSSPEYQLRDKERKDSKDYNIATLESNLALAKMQNQQSILDREYLERRDLRDYNYQMRQDKQESLDRIFAILLGGIDKSF